VAGLRYEAVTVKREWFFGVTRVWVNERNQVAIFDPERALLDAFRHFHIFGSFSTGLEILESHLDDIDPERFARYALQLQVAAVVKRIGWALNRLEASSNILEPLRQYPSKGDTLLDPARPARGRHNRNWQVIENLSDG
jgi:predicted transcriptional regulator of viral defense system